MSEDQMQFNSSTDFPEVLNPAHNNLSVDVLIYSSKTDEHTVGWFDFNTMTWRFLCRESQTSFKWRYFNDKTDKAQ